MMIFMPLLHLFKRRIYFFKYRRFTVQVNINKWISLIHFCFIFRIYFLFCFCFVSNYIFWIFHFILLFSSFIFLFYHFYFLTTIMIMVQFHLISGKSRMEKMRCICFRPWIVDCFCLSKKSFEQYFSIIFNCTETRTWMKMFSMKNNNYFDIPFQHSQFRWKVIDYLAHCIALRLQFIENNFISQTFFHSGFSFSNNVATLRFYGFFSIIYSFLFQKDSSSKSTSIFHVVHVVLYERVCTCVYVCMCMYECVCVLWLIILHSTWFSGCNILYFFLEFQFNFLIGDICQELFRYLNFVVSKFICNIGILSAPLSFATAIVESSSTLGCTTMSWIRLTSW